MSNQRRSFLKNTGMAGILAAGSAPAFAQSSPTIKWRCASSFPKSLDTIYGAAETAAKAVSDITVGVELIARRVVRVLLRTWSAPADGARQLADRPFFGIYLPAHADNRQSAQRSLIGPEDKFAPGGMIELDTGNARYLIRFTQTLERQAGWAWAMFSAVRKLGP